MNSAIVTIGDEILIGQITDTNAVWIAQHLNMNGVAVMEMTTVPDEAEAIRSTLDRLVGRVELVILTGGLGPTSDDITKETLCGYFESRMVTNNVVLERITRYFRERGRKMLDTNARQADVPEACQVLLNDHGTAPGMWFEKDNTIVVSLPGVPYEMEGLMNDQVLPRLKAMITVPSVVHRTIMTQGVPESYLAALLRDWEKNLPGCVKLAYLPRPGIVRLRLTAVDKCAENSEEILQVCIDKVLKIIPKHIFGFDDIPLEKALGEVLREHRLSLSTAESCTGGNIARLITSVPGSSDYYTGSVIAYDNRVKTDRLGVDPVTIRENGVVSREVVEEMARGCMELFSTDTAIAVSGIAGPEGGTSDKAVGTTWICVAHDKKVRSVKYLFPGSRVRIITQASMAGMQLLRRLVLDLL